MDWRRASRRRLAGLDVLALTALVWFLAKFLRYLFPPLFGTFHATYGASDAVLGLAFTGLMLVYAGMQFPSGALGDRIGPVRVLSAGSVIAALGALWVASTATFPALVAGMLLVGLGTGAHKTVAVRLLSTVYAGRPGRALGAYDTVGAFGGVVAPALVVLALERPAFDWRHLFLVGGVVGLGLTATFVRRVPGRVTTPSADADGTGASLREHTALFADRRVAAFVLVTVLFGFGYNGVVAFLPRFLTDAGGLGGATAGTLYGALFLVSPIQAVTGDASDRFGRLRVMAALLAVATAGLGALLVVSGPIALGAAVVGLGVGSHGFRPIRGAHLVAIAPDAAAGGTLGIVRTALMGAGAIAPAVVGALADATTFRVAFGTLLGALVLATALALGLARAET